MTMVNVQNSTLAGAVARSTYTWLNCVLNSCRTASIAASASGGWMEDNEDAARENVDFTAGIAPLAIGIKHRESAGELWRDVVRQKLAPFLRIHDCHVEP